MTSLREYIVTLHKHEDLDDFYQDMETPGGNLYIPGRVVEVAHRRPISRNTHYLLTQEEADLIKKDPRVLDVALSMKESGIEYRPAWTQTANFSKDFTTSTNDKNWGLLTTTTGSLVPDWGSDGTTQRVTETISRKLSGRNVDVVIVDGHIKANHAEFSVNINGTGGSRVNQFDWFSLDSAAVGTHPFPNYSYVDSTNNGLHGTHVASTAAGNTQGWARDANIYNISPYGDMGVSARFFDYIRYWHATKPINPNTGRRNPTIVNNSYSSYGRVYISALNLNTANVIFRGTTLTGTFSQTGVDSTDWTSLGFSSQAFVESTQGQPDDYYLEVILPTHALLADIQDCINDGIIIVFASANENRKIDVAGGQDVDNRISQGSISYYINRHSILGDNSVGAIIVGNWSSFVTPTKSSNSNKGPGITIFAPGTAIVGASDSNIHTPDPRGLNQDTILVLGGSSMASPQVAGVIACFLELKPWFTQTQVNNWLIDTAKNNLVAELGNDSFSSIFHLSGAPNRVLYFPDQAYTISESVTSIGPGQTISYIVNVNVPDGSTLYFKEIGTAVASDFVDNKTQEFGNVINNTITITRTLSSGFSGSKTSQIQVLTGGYQGTVQITSNIINLTSTIGTLYKNTLAIDWQEKYPGEFFVCSFVTNDFRSGLWQVVSDNSSLANVSGIIITPSSGGGSMFSVTAGATATSATANIAIQRNVGQGFITVAEKTLTVLPKGVLNRPNPRFFKYLLQADSYNKYYGEDIIFTITTIDDVDDSVEPRFRVTSSNISIANFTHLSSPFQSNKKGIDQFRVATSSGFTQQTTVTFSLEFNRFYEWVVADQVYVTFYPASSILPEYYVIKVDKSNLEVVEGNIVNFLFTTSDTQNLTWSSNIIVPSGEASNLLTEPKFYLSGSTVDLSVNTSSLKSLTSFQTLANNVSGIENVTFKLENGTIAVAQDIIVQDVSSPRSTNTANLTPKFFRVDSNGTNSFSISDYWYVSYSNNPTIVLIRGYTYEFYLETTQHPFWIKTANVTGTGSAYQYGITNNGSNNINIPVKFIVPYDAPDTLYYVCQYHNTMSGEFFVTDLPFETPPPGPSPSPSPTPSPTPTPSQTRTPTPTPTSTPSSTPSPTPTSTPSPTPTPTPSASFGSSPSPSPSPTPTPGASFGSSPSPVPTRTPTPSPTTTPTPSPTPTPTPTPTPSQSPGTVFTYSLTPNVYYIKEANSVSLTFSTTDPRSITWAINSNNPALINVNGIVINPIVNQSVYSQQFTIQTGTLSSGLTANIVTLIISRTISSTSENVATLDLIVYKPRPLPIQPVTLTNLTGGPSVFTTEITPPAGNIGSITVIIPAGSVTDINGNTNKYPASLTINYNTT